MRYFRLGATLIAVLVEIAFLSYLAEGHFFFGKWMNGDYVLVFRP